VPLSPAKEATAVNAVKMTWADRMKDEGRLEGRQEGRQEGRNQGLQEGEEMGARKLLLALLEQRFGQLPPFARRGVAALRSADRLTQLARNLLAAGSLAELGLE
jgi:flagellar biosynthesis/type III secretory pathway protein FliH